MSAEPFEILDVFSGGCGGWSLGLEAAGGFVTRAVCEVDPLRRQMLAHNFPKARQYADIRDVTATRLRADGIRVNGLFGSPPCKDHSAANQVRKGIEGEDGKLVFEFVRLVGEIRPRWFGFENSPRLIRGGGDRVFDDLEALGYAVTPLRLSASAFGAPHERDRLYCIGFNSDQISRQARVLGARGAQPLAQSNAGGGAVDRAGVEGRDANENASHESGTIHGRAYARPWRRSIGGGASERTDSTGSEGSDAAQEPLELRGLARESVRGDGFRGGYHRQPWGRDWIASLGGHASSFDGVSATLAKRAAEMYGDAIVPQIAEAIGHAIHAAERAAGEEKARAQDALEIKRSGGRDDGARAKRAGRKSV